MKVTLITRFYPPDTGGGGIAAYARYAAIGLVKAGHRVRVISAKAENSKERQIVDGVEVFRITPPLSAYRWTRLPFVGSQMRFIRDLLYAWRVSQFLRSGAVGFQPDIVEYADIDAESFFHPTSICPNVVKLHTPHSVLKSFYSRKEMPYALRGIEWMERIAILSAQGVSSPSLNLAEQVALNENLERTKIRYVPNFIDTDLFTPGPATGELQRHCVLFVGRLEPLKGAVIFAEAIPMIAEEYPNTRFVFLGADRMAENGASQKSQLQFYFIQKGLQDCVEFHGHSTRDVFLAHYRHASVFVIPSLFENSPYTLLEAMSCGKACVVSRSGGMTEMIVDGESGIFFEAGNSQDLAEKVITLLRKPGFRKSLGRAARERVEREYSLDVGMDKTVAFYRDVLTGIKNAHPSG